MKKMLIGAMASVAMLAGAAAPAEAGPWGPRGYWGGPRYGGGYYRRGGGDAFGNFLLGAVIAGGAVALATSAGRNRDRDARPEVRSNGRFDLNAAGEDAREVASICSDAAETMARGRVLGVDSVGRDGDGWRVEGVVDADRGQRHFSCGARAGAVDFVQFAER
ncbi:hypothetical protein [Sphingomonas montanisoli]|uniref:Secreted protein n=1 Tax=Sphingomonas montanisoli TaxID=2606412 RepID=A0A5D9CCR1_9SPHN|nr:hypothetical protein [Sphingomonas montanisoli]TZG29126.1 hypothetical protein FYJ91_03035 [Sphingomonas montanisoli]